MIRHLCCVQGDIEHITVQATQKGELIAVWYAAHGTETGAWVPAKDVTTDAATGRIKVYVAYHSHASYPLPGVWHYDEEGHGSRTIFANDETDEGAKLYPAEAIVLTNRGDVDGSVPQLPVGTKGQYSAAMPFAGGDAGPATFKPQNWPFWHLRLGAADPGEAHDGTPLMPAWQGWFYDAEKAIGREDGEWDTRHK